MGLSGISMLNSLILSLWTSAKKTKSRLLQPAYWMQVDMSVMIFNVTLIIKSHLTVPYKNVPNLHYFPLTLS